MCSVQPGLPTVTGSTPSWPQCPLPTAETPCKLGDGRGTGRLREFSSLLVFLGLEVTPETDSVMRNRSRMSSVICFRLLPFHHLHSPSGGPGSLSSP